MEKSYTTRDIYRAAAFWVCTDLPPDAFLYADGSTPVVVMMWNDRSQLPLEDFENQQLAVEPTAYIEKLKALRNKVLKMVNEKKKEVTK